MRIKLFDDYKSAAGLFIPRGEYSSEDPVLQGQAKYLVESKHAVWVAELVSTEGAEESATIEEHSEETVTGGVSVPGITEETVDLSTLTKKGLIELAAKRGIELGNAPEKKTNAELIALIEAANLGTPIEPIQGEGGEA